MRASVNVRVDWGYVIRGGNRRRRDIKGKIASGGFPIFTQHVWPLAIRRTACSSDLTQAVMVGV